MKLYFLFLIFLSSHFSGFSQKHDTLYVDVKGARLHCVLSTPSKKNVPVALIIAGSGPTDLNGNQNGMMNNSLLMLSEGLVKKNIATLRFDKRGVGKSTVDIKDESLLNFKDFSDDVTEIIKGLRNKGFEEIFIIGHSEGSLIGMIAAKNTPVSGFISLAGSGHSLDELLKAQLKKQPLSTDQLKRCENILDSLKSGFRVNNTPKELDALFRPAIQPFLISLFAYSPSDLFKQLTIPKLIIQGTSDLQIPMEEAEYLLGSETECNLLKIEGMNHVLKIVNDDMNENVRSYNSTDLPVSKKLIKHIAGFID